MSKCTAASALRGALLSFVCYLLCLLLCALVSALLRTALRVSRRHHITRVARQRNATREIRARSKPSDQYNKPQRLPPGHPSRTPIAPKAISTPSNAPLLIKAIRALTDDIPISHARRAGIQRLRLCVRRNRRRDIACGDFMDDGLGGGRGRILGQGG